MTHLVLNNNNNNNNNNNGLMLITQSGSYITIPTFKLKNKKIKDIYRIIRKKNLQSAEKNNPLILSHKSCRRYVSYWQAVKNLRSTVLKGSFDQWDC